MVVFTNTSEDQALQIVNDTESGLNDAVYSADPNRALAIARRMESGTIRINNGQYADPGDAVRGRQAVALRAGAGGPRDWTLASRPVIYFDRREFPGLRRLRPATAVQTSVLVGATGIEPVSPRL
jgi:hypothetical protein